MDWAKTDLFGHPTARNKGSRGRQGHVPTQETANEIKVLLALGHTRKKISSVIGISEPTLRRDYFSDEAQFRVEPKGVRERLELALIRPQIDAALGGDTTAFNAVMKRLDRIDRITAAKREAAALARARAAMEAQPPKLGKKEQRVADAKEPIPAGDIWDGLLN